MPFTRENDPWYLYLGASIPALLLTILLFMDQQITSVIVNRSEHKLRVSTGPALTPKLEVLTILQLGCRKGPDITWICLWLAS